MIFEECQDKCPWKQGKWCKPMNIGMSTGRTLCEESNCPFWCLKDINKKE